jgi:hypothetical protein
MPRKPNVALAASVLVTLTLGVGSAYYSVDARPASPEAATAVSRAASAAGSGRCAPKYKAKKTLFGINTGGLMGSSWGKVPALRTWDNSDTIAGAWKNLTRSTSRKTAMVVSIQHSPQSVVAGDWDSQLNAFFKHAPKKRLIFWNYYHEPETGVKAKQFTPTQFKRAFRHIDRIAARYCRPNLVPTLVLMGWTADPDSGKSVKYLWNSWRDFYPGKHYVSVVAWDPYNYATVRPPKYKTPGELFRYCVADARQVGKPWAVAEIGSALVSGDQGSGRAAWLHRVAKYSRKHDASFVTYFSSRGLVNDFRLSDAPSRNAWRQIMNH